MIQRYLDAFNKPKLLHTPADELVLAIGGTIIFIAVMAVLAVAILLVLWFIERLKRKP